MKAIKTERGHCIFGPWEAKAYKLDNGKYLARIYVDGHHLKSADFRTSDRAEAIEAMGWMNHNIAPHIGIAVTHMGDGRVLVQPWAWKMDKKRRALK